MNSVRVVIPVRHECDIISVQKDHWYALRDLGLDVCFVDGQSGDGTKETLETLGFRVLSSPPGRAIQMNLGAKEFKGGLLIFLHADTRLPLGAIGSLRQFFAGKTVFWGRFDVKIVGRSAMFPVISYLINLRSRLSGIATGDQAIFVSTALFEQVGGFPQQPLMEDIELSKRLLKFKRPLCLRWKVETSGRRWETYGVVRTIFLMWVLRFAYWRGVPAEDLKRRYL